MGSLPECTLCVYCGVHEATFIVDGCCGAVCCGEYPDGVPDCLDRADLIGWPAILSQRLVRLGMSWGATKARNVFAAMPDAFQLSEVRVAVFSYLWESYPHNSVYYQ